MTVLQFLSVSLSISSLFFVSWHWFTSCEQPLVRYLAVHGLSTCLEDKEEKRNEMIVPERALLSYSALIAIIIIVIFLFSRDLIHTLRRKAGKIFLQSLFSTNKPSQLREKIVEETFILLPAYTWAQISNSFIVCCPLLNLVSTS